LGADGAIWGGEFFLVDPGGLRRAAHLRTFPLPGGDKAAREGRRSAVGLLFEAFGPGLSRMGPLPPLLEFPAGDLGVLEAMCRSGANAPRTSSAGRLFDAAASLLGLRQRSSYEGQAAMELEYAAAPFDTREGYPMPLGGPSGEGPRVLDWGPLLESLLEDARRGVPAGLISARFHNSLAEAIAETALRLGRERVALSGGCFQNRRLSEGVIARLRSKGLSPYWHQRVPPNDGGIALGQAMAAQRLP
jgi:hydrogenase maturation protein HypF